MSAEALIEKLRNNEIDPEEAVRKFELPAVHIGDISFSNLKVETIPSGFPTLDEYMFLKRDRSELIIFGARPGMGKSSFMFQLAANVAAQGNVLVYSLEMDKENILTRLMALTSGRSVSAFQKGIVPNDKVTKTHKALAGLNLFIDDRPRLNIGDIRNSANIHNRHRKLDLIVVDYLQLIKTAEKGTRDAEIGVITGELKALAKDVKCPVIVGSQLNRASETRGRDGGDYRPQLSDLRESGNIEQDADQVLFLSRQVVYDGQRAGEADISVAKNRNGKTGSFIMKFSQEQTKFFDIKDIGI